MLFSFLPQDFGDLKGALVVDGVDDDDPVCDREQMLRQLLGKVARVLGLDPFGVVEPQVLNRSAVRIHVGVVDVFQGRVKRLKRIQVIKINILKF